MMGASSSRRCQVSGTVIVLALMGALVPAATLQPGGGWNVSGYEGS